MMWKRLAILSLLGLTVCSCSSHAKKPESLAPSVEPIAQSEKSSDSSAPDSDRGEQDLSVKETTLSEDEPSSTPDGGTPNATTSSDRITDEEHQAWCKQARRPRKWGPPGRYEEHLPRLKGTKCKDRFTYRVVDFYYDAEQLYCVDGCYKVAVVYLTDKRETKEVFTFKLNGNVGWASQSLKRFQIGDVDGDGTAEVFIGVYTYEEGFFEWWSTLLTMKNEKLEPVILPNDYKAAGLIDIDKDGLYDIIFNGPYDGIGNYSEIGGKSPVFWKEGLFLLHSKGGFEFSLNDEWSQKRIRKRCPKRILSRFIENTYMKMNIVGPEPKSKGSADWRNPLQVVCARVFGKDTQKVSRRIRAQCKTFGDPPRDDDGCHKSLLKIAVQDPPLQIEP